MLSPQTIMPMKLIFALLIIVSVSLLCPAAGPEMKIYEVQQELIRPFLERAASQPDALETLLPRMDEMNGQGKLRLLAQISFPEPAEKNLPIVMANNTLSQKDDEPHKYNTTGEWYHELGVRTLTMKRVIKRGVNLPGLEFQLAHILGKQWGLSAAVATPHGFLLVIERWEKSPDQSASPGWIAAPSPPEKIKLSIERMPSVVGDFSRWGVGGFIVKLPQYKDEWAPALIKMTYEVLELNDRSQTLDFKAQIRYYPDNQSLISLNYSGEFYDKRTAYGFTYKIHNANPSTNIDNSVQIASKESNLVRREVIEKAGTYTNTAKETNEKTLIQMVVFKDKLP